MAQLKKIQAQMTVNGLIHNAFPTGRVLPYCALSDVGDLGYARALFDRIEDRKVCILNTKVRGVLQGWIWVDGVGFVSRDGERRCGIGMLDLRSFMFRLKACESVHCWVVKVGFEGDGLVRNELTHSHGGKGETFDARKMFDESADRGVVWTLLD
uniref:Uncharacterized protein n=1 Tax=Kalanchoe fedtschenkoi TaxID=63787 RepID=A0A7N0TLQ6_KALFE